MILICIMGKSGSGKSGIEKGIEQLGYNRIISYTTRDIRQGEVNGVHYHFVNREQFEQLVKKDILMEHATYNGNLYGSARPIGTVNNVVVVEPEGYEQIKEIYGKQVVGVYVDVDTEISKRRAIGRLEKTTKKDMCEINNRVTEDRCKFRGIENKVDVVVDGSKQIGVSVAKILQFIGLLKKGV